MQKILKNEKGSISLFVLLAALFFLVVVTGVGVSLKNKEAEIDAHFEKTKTSYEKDVDNEEQIYNKKVNKTVTFDANGGTVNIHSKTVKLGDTYGELPTPTREGYTFKGWNGKNKFDKDSIDNTHFIITATGEVSSKTGSNRLDDWASSNMIKVEPNTTLIKSGSIDAKTQDYFDADNNLIEVTNIANDESFITPNNCYYVKFNLKRTNFPYTNVQLEQGSTATEYEPYFVTTSTKVTQNNNDRYILTAIWEQN